MIGQLRHRESFQAMHFAGFVNLLFGAVPLSLRLLLGFADFARRHVLAGVLHSLLLFVTRRNELQHSRRGRDHGLQRNLPAICQMQLVKLDPHLMSRREIRIHGRNGASRLRDALDRGHLARDLAACRYQQFVEGIHRFQNFSMNRLAYFADAHLLVERDFQRRAGWHGQGDRRGWRRSGGRRGFRRS